MEPWKSRKTELFVYYVGKKISSGAFPPRELVPPPSRSLFIFGLLAALINEDSPFPPSSWAGLTFKTTNNGAESFHRHFGDLFGYLHTKPNIWEFLRTIRLYNELKDTKIVSKKTVKETTDFWTIHIEEYVNKKISAVKLLDKLSIKCQPKMSLKKNR